MSSKAKKRRRNEERTNDDDADYVDVATSDEPNEEGEDDSISLELEIEEEEEKPKPILTLQYQGFSIYGQCLCVVVEPWPVVRSKVVAPVFANTAAVSVAAPVEKSIRAETPLFLPEENEETTNERHSTVNQSFLDQILKDVDTSDEEDDMGGMLEFSQVLHNAGDSRAGAANDDDDDIDDSILFGDADERREF